MPFNPNAWPEKDPGEVAAISYANNAKQLYVWKTNGENCPACNKLANRCYPWAYWQATIQPGFHDNCDCRLVPAGPGVFESPHDLWGTEPLWWDPTLDPWQFLVNLFDRYLKFLQRQGQGDKYSGFDNLFPVFMSETGFTTAPGTLGMGNKNTISPLFDLFKEWLGLGKDKFNARYRIRINGYAGIGSFQSSIWRKLRDPGIYLPSEGVPSEPYDSPYPDWY